MWDDKEREFVHEFAALSNESRNEWINLIVNNQSQINNSVLTTDFLSNDKNDFKMINSIDSIDQQHACSYTRLNCDISKVQFDKKDSGKI